MKDLCDRNKDTCGDVVVCVVLWMDVCAAVDSCLYQ
jgi:hypothetical protein